MRVKKESQTQKATESSSAFFARLRPKFLDWRPPTEEEKALEVKARREAREAELRRVTELARKREEEKAAKSRKRNRMAFASTKQRKRG